MNKKFKLSDDILEEVTGGVEIAKGSLSGTKKVSSRIDMICPKCGNTVHQEFYTDGTVKYPKCPNRTQDGKSCNNLLGEG